MHWKQSSAVSEAVLSRCSWCVVVVDPGGVIMIGTVTVPGGGSLARRELKSHPSGVIVLNSVETIHHSPVGEAGSLHGIPLWEQVGYSAVPSWAHSAILPWGCSTCQARRMGGQIASVTC